MEMMLSRETPKKQKQMPHINQIKNSIISYNLFKLLIR
jgi:hypothetical protein